MIDPQAEPLLRMMTDGLPLNQRGLDGARQWAAERSAPLAPADPRLVTSELAVSGRHGDVPIRVYRPVDSERPGVVVFIHGGGWILGNLDSADPACRRLSLSSGCAVVSVDYRLAPEGEYPVALDDCVDVVRWLVTAGGDALGVDASRLCISGESSGGQLAATTCVAMRDEAIPVTLQLLVNPALDARMDTPSWHEFGGEYLPVAEQMSWMWDLYAGSPQRRSDPGVSVAELTDLSGLAPALIITAEYDPLRDEAEEYGARLQQAGVAAEVRRYDGQIHAMFGLSAYVDRCGEALDEAAAAIAGALAPNKIGEDHGVHA